MTQLDPLKKSEPLQYEGIVLAETTDPSEVPEERKAAPNLTFDVSRVGSSDVARETIRKWFQQFTNLAELRVSPISQDCSVNTGYVFGKRGLLYSTWTKKVGRPRSIDWKATCTELGDRALEHNNHASTMPLSGFNDSTRLIQSTSR